MRGNRCYRPLVLESLEGRCVPSTVTNLNDYDSGSLRDAIATTPAGGTVDFQPGLSGTITLTSGELLIAKDLTIAGPGAGVITVSGNHAGRVFDVAASFVVALSGLTVSDGGVTDGGGILNRGTLDVRDCVLSDNSANSGAGGGVLNVGGRLTITDSTLSGNSAGDGGGVYNYTGAVTVSASAFRGNSATGFGGGIDNESPVPMAVTNSTFAGNSARDGGGVFNDGTLAVAASAFCDNTANSGGGGILSFGGSTLAVAESAFCGNSSGHPGAGIYNDYGRLTITASTFSGNAAGSYGGGGIYNYGGTVAVTASDFCGNSAAYDSAGYGGYGGGILNGSSGLSVTVTASTFSGNTATDGGGGVYSQSSFFPLALTGSTFSGNYAGGHGGSGGGIGVEGGAVTVGSSTFSGNRAELSGGGIWAGGGTLTVTNATLGGNAAGANGGAIEARGGTVTMANSTVSGNRANDVGGGLDVRGGTVRPRNTIIAGNSGDPLMGGADVWGRLDSEGHNLIGDSLGGSGFADTDLLNLDPLLGPLQDNGGPTETMALLPGSPALNAGDPAELGNPDQRSVVRAGGVNIGAYQASASAFVISAPDTVQSGVPFDAIVTAVDSFGQVAVGYTGTVTFSTSDTDPGVVLPADYTFAAADAGVHTFTDTGLGEITLATPGDQTLTVTDTSDDTINGNATITVMGGNAAWTHDSFWVDLAPNLVLADRRH
jgi:predicted outer membrane repeat protein